MMARLTSVSCKKERCSKLLTSYNARRYAGLCPNCYATRYDKEEAEMNK